VNGQWVGAYAGTTDGAIIVNLDEFELNYQGVAYLLPTDNNTFLGTVAYFRTPNKGAHFQFRTDAILAIDLSNPTSGFIAPWDTVKQRYPTIVGFSKYADVTGSWDESTLTLNWTSDIGTTGNCVLPIESRIK
jgi:hypothetical protein